ncbi:nitrogen fixation protein NifQ [Quatrionicoccus australiensis]|uniref:nitrogen fixation protein NifQ n=1 Tax=Quatrionicoccus australiensis TaxID=138118 RepID=UPI001CFAEF0A|nr:nitrogen fixation protein NifQ [Quatrionicoccus australiensis]MCB4360986.1 nitrogen fixation protein NifQ [Quatrionicoccus australiensis]
MNGPDRRLAREVIFAELLLAPCSSKAAGDPNRSLLASMLAGQGIGEGCLPPDLGLGEEVFRHLLGEYFPDAEFSGHSRQVEAIPEWSDLQKLLLEHRARQHPSELLLANIVATACAGRDHLWQDLGLLNRAELSSLMWANFPALAAANTGDMKWKKFLYRQFCSREGIYVCPAPSCGQCQEYAKCFGPEN